MRWSFLLLGLLFVTIAAAEDDEEELPLAEACDAEACQLPDCRCSSTNIPGGLAPRDTPQFVVVAFEDSVNVINIETYREVLFGRLNSNGCPAGATFYVSHLYNNYQLVNELYNQGFEIGLHSMTREGSQEYWREASYEDLIQEFADQRTQMAHFAAIPSTEIRGIRKPFLQLSGNNTFKMLADAGFLYDSSWPTISHRNPGLWPYTLDYATIQDCVSGPCPTASIPGPWVLPIITWVDLAGFPCSVMNACFSFPDQNDENAWLEFIFNQFERHYFGSRAPFAVHAGEGFLRSFPAVKNALIRFLNAVNKLNDAFMVNSHEVIDWVKDPIPVNEYRQKSCRTFPRTACFPASSCGPYEPDYWLQLCNSCPPRYPWLGNPLGQ